MNAGSLNWLTLPLTVGCFDNDAAGSNERLGLEQIVDVSFIHSLIWNYYAYDVLTLWITIYSSTQLPCPCSFLTRL